MSVTNWMDSCAEHGERVGMYGAAVGAVAGGGHGAAAGGSIGGLYGCLTPGANPAEAFEAASRETGRQWRRAKRIARRVYRWVAGLFGGGGSKKAKRKPKPPPTFDDSINMLILHLSERGGSSTGLPPYQFELPTGRKGWQQTRASYPLHPSTRVALFGPIAGRWSATKLYAHVATMWNKTPRSWPAEVRWTVAVRRVGDFFVEAPAGADIVAWPLVPADEQARAIDLRRQLLEDMADDAKEEALRSEDPGPGLGIAVTGLTFGAVARRVADYWAGRDDG